MRRYFWILPVVAALSVVGVASADIKEQDAESPAAATGPNCDLTGYKSETQVLNPPFAIPDNGRIDVIAGILPTVADGSVITDVVLEVNMNHTWMGDVIVRLEYRDCATGATLYGTNVICRPRGTNVTPNAPCGSGTGVGCSGNLGSSAANTPQPGSVPYRFTDPAPTAIGEGVCPTVAASGCYKPSPGGLLAGFSGHLKGGCWVLLTSDWAGLDVGSISSWTVWELNTGPVVTKSASWGNMKMMYR